MKKQSTQNRQKERDGAKMDRKKDVLIEFRKLVDDKSKIEKRRLPFYVLLIFFVSCITGWVYEEFFYFLTENIVEKRGFLYGPYLPVYGVGSLVMLLLLKRWDRNPIIIFGGSMLIAGVIEYITGAAMMEIWDKQWWDYTGLFMAIDGYVCLRSVVSFAVLALILFYILEPVVKAITNRMSDLALVVAPSVIGLTFIVDLIVTLIYRNPL